MESNIFNSNGENVVSVNLKLSYFSFLKIVEIEFKMKLQGFVVRISQVLANHEFSYLSPHILEWNGLKLPIFKKIYIIR